MSTLRLGDMADTQLALFEIRLKPNTTKLHINRVALRQIVIQIKDPLLSGALAVFVDDEKGKWRFSFIAKSGSHSLQVGSRAEVLLAGDDNTWSSATDRPGGLALAATAVNGNVLAIGDIQFLMEPYYTVEDNAQFIAQIADFLASPIEGDYTVADFPYFFAPEVDLVYTGGPQLGPNAFDEIITLQASLREADKALSLTTVEAQSGDALYLGLYNQADDVAEVLADAGITLTISPTILTRRRECDFP